MSKAKQINGFWVTLCWDLVRFCFYHETTYFRLEMNGTKPKPTVPVLRPRTTKKLQGRCLGMVGLLETHELF